LISSDGRFVVFSSFAKNLVANDLSLGVNIFWRDLQTGTTYALNTNGNAAFPSMSDDGTRVAYRFTYGFPVQLRVWDAQSRSNIFSIANDIFSPGGFIPTLSPDGRKVIYQSAASAGYAIVAHDLI